MNFTVKAKNLSEELGLLASVSEKRKTQPVLAYSSVEAVSDNHLKFTSTDTQNTLECVIPQVEFKQKGEICVHSKRLSELTSRFAPDEPVRFSSDESAGFVHLSQGKSRFKLASISPGAFPKIPDQFSGKINLPSEALKRMFRLVAPFTGEDDSTYAFSNAGLSSDGEKLKIAASTGGTSFAYSEFPFKSDEKFNCLLPVKSLKQISSLADSYSGETVETDFSLGADGKLNKLRFRFGTRRLTVTLPVGTFPDYSPILAVQHKHTAEIDTAELKEKLERLKIVLDKKNGNPLLALSNQEAEITVEHCDIGTGTETVNLKSMTPELPEPPVKIRINLEAFSLFLQAASKIAPKKNSTVSFSFTDAHSICELGVSEAGQMFRFLLMPNRDLS